MCIADTNAEGAIGRAIAMIKDNKFTDLNTCKEDWFGDTTQRSVMLFYSERGLYSTYIHGINYPRSQIIQIKFKFYFS